MEPSILLVMPMYDEAIELLKKIVGDKTLDDEDLLELWTSVKQLHRLLTIMDEMDLSNEEAATILKVLIKWGGVDEDSAVDDSEG